MRTMAGWAGWLVRALEDWLDKPHDDYREALKYGAPMWLRNVRERLYAYANGPIFTDP